MRIGTWNLAGRWTANHLRLIQEQRCDVWLLTEVGARTSIPGSLVRSDEMPRTGGRSWAAVWSAEPLGAGTAGHEAAALARWRDVDICSCVLPWRGAATSWPDKAANTAGRTVAALDRLRPAVISSTVPVVWGGDWNHSMSGTERAGSMEGRIAILELVADAGLDVATGRLSHRIEGALSIDHIAVPASWILESAARIVATAEGRRLSDHDAFVVEVASR